MIDTVRFFSFINHLSVGITQTISKVKMYTNSRHCHTAHFDYMKSNTY
jgi:hypothetical protein